MKIILIIQTLLILASCNNYIEVKGTQKAEDVFYNYYKEQALQKKAKDKEESYLLTVQWDSFSLESNIWDVLKPKEDQTMDGQLVSDPLSSLGVSYSSKKICNTEHVYCKEEEYPLPKLRKDKNSVPLDIGSKFTLIGKVIKSSEGLELVEIISLTQQGKTEKEKICKRGVIRKEEFKAGDEVYFTSDASFAAKKLNSHSFESVYGSKSNVDYSRSYKILEITEGDYKPFNESYGTKRLLKFRNDLWVFPEKDVLPVKTLMCDLIDQIGIQQMRVKLKDGANLEFNGTKITRDNPDFKNGIQCIKQRLGIVECGWASGFNLPVKLDYEDKRRYFFSDIDFINNFEPYFEVRNQLKEATDVSSYEVRAEKLMRNGKYKEGLILLDKACELKSAEACYNAGVFLTQKMKLQKEGMEYYFEACELKLSQACYNIAGIQLKGDINSRFEALSNFEKACSLGLKQSCVTKDRLKKLFIEKKANGSYEILFENLFPETIQDLKEKDLYQGVHAGPRT